MKIRFAKKYIKDNQIINVDEVQTVPIIEHNFKRDKLYTLIMVDQDAPSRKNPVNKYWLHWIMININDRGLGDEAIKYQPGSPPQGSGLHRYCFILFEQPYEIKNNTILKFVDGNRAKFSPLQFEKRFDLKPIACITFLTEKK